MAVRGLDRAGARRRWPSCAASVVVLLALLLVLFPGLAAVAGPSAPADAASAVRVRVAPAHGALGGGPMSPGEVAYRPVRVHNDGPARFRYGLGIRAAGALADLITVEFRAVGPVCDEHAFLRSAERLGPRGPMSRVAGQGGRLLGPGASELLCARVALPAGAVIAPGAAADAVLRVTATGR